MTLPSCLRSSIDHGFHDRLGRGRGGRLKKSSKLSSSSALSDANTSRRDGWAAAPPTFIAPLDFPAKDSICTDLSGGRWRRGARLCARLAAVRLPFQEPALGLREVPKSQWLPGPASLGADRRRPPPIPLPPLLPPSPARARRPVLLSRAALSPSFWLRAPARSGLGVGAAGESRLGSPEPAGPGRPAESAVIGAAPAPLPPPVRPARPAARPGPGAPAGARPLSARPFGCQRPRGWRRTPPGRQRGPRWVCLPVRGRGGRRWVGARPRRAPWEAGLFTERKAGGGIRVEFPLASPSYCCVAVRRCSARQDRRADRAEGARPGKRLSTDPRCEASSGREQIPALSRWSGNRVWTARLQEEQEGAPGWPGWMGAELCAGWAAGFWAVWDWRGCVPACARVLLTVRARLLLAFVKVALS